MGGLTGRSYAEEGVAAAALTHLAWELRFMITKARLVLDGGSLDAETAQQLTQALDTMAELRGQLDELAGRG